MTNAVALKLRVPILIASPLAVFAALIAVALVSTLTDQIFHELEIFPPWGQAMPDSGDNLIALAYRTLFAICGGYLAARLAPFAPRGHAVALGVVSAILTLVGTIAADATMGDLGPDWYWIALAVTAVPFTWYGGYFAGRR